MNELYIFSLRHKANPFQNAAVDALSIGTNQSLLSNQPQEQSVYLSDLGAYRSTFHFVRYDSDASMKIANVKYNKGLKFDTAGRGWSGTSYFNLNGSYSRLIGLIGLDDITENSNKNVTLNFSSDDEVLQTIVMHPGDLPVEVNIDVNGLHRLMIILKPVDIRPIIDLIDMKLQ